MRFCLSHSLLNHFSCLFLLWLFGARRCHTASDCRWRSRRRRRPTTRQTATDHSVHRRARRTPHEARAQFTVYVVNRFLANSCCTTAAPATRTQQKRRKHTGCERCLSHVRMFRTFRRANEGRRSLHRIEEPADCVRYTTALVRQSFFYTLYSQREVTQ